MGTKEFKTIDEQIKILESRGLTINDIDEAYLFLYENNYYRISGYSLTLRKNDIFYENTSMQDIMDIYIFDQELRHTLLKYLEKIEVKMKSIYAYEFVQIYEPIGYLDSQNFTDHQRYHQIMSKAETQKQKSLKHEAYVKHYIKDLKQPLPFWAYIDLFTISDISLLYSISEKKLKKEVAQQMGITVSIGPELLGQFMHSMTILRNFCAHGSRLFNRLFEQKPSLNRKERDLLIANEDGTKDNAHLYGFIFIMRRLLNKSEFEKLKVEIIQLSQKYPFVSMHHYGFRDDWRKQL
ncbi:Abi family protein [Salinicoccus roseus]|uniref:Abi family protein n=1 Tax=Salinicoccus roseus TaxID=45670 RepID=UPI001EF48911|nr:Abi family protein [Salinicoccus roseus]MCG7332580.1 Abi family protein [Salinicoccus roseus]